MAIYLTDKPHVATYSYLVCRTPELQSRIDNEIINISCKRAFPNIFILRKNGIKIDLSLIPRAFDCIIDVESILVRQ